MFNEHDYAERAEEVYSKPEDAEAAVAFLENDDVGEFMAMHGTERGYECAIFKMVKAPTSGNIQRAHQITYTDAIPGADTIVQQFGPGEYEWQLASRVKKRLEGQDRFIVVKKTLVGPHWEKMHRRFQEEEEFRERKERRERIRKQAEEDRLEYGGMAPAQGFGPKDMMEILVAMRGATAPPAPTDPMTLMIVSKMLDQGGSKGLDFNGIAALLGALSPAATAIFNRLNPPPAQHVPSPMDKMMEKFVEALVDKKVESLSPPEPESPWFVPILEGFAENLPAVIDSLSKMPAFMRPSVAQAAVKQTIPRGEEMVNAIKRDPEAIAALVAKWDEQYSYEQVNLLLDSVDIPRPPSTVRQEAAAGAE